MSTVSILNTDAQLSGKTLADLESTQTVTGAKSFNRSPLAPFAVQAASAVVTNLDADKLDGQHGTYYNDPTNLSASVAVNKGGTGVATLAAHGVVIGEGTSAVAVTGAGTAGQVLTSNGAAADPTFQGSGGVRLLSAQGSDTTAGNANVSTIAITGLLATDRLVIYISFESLVQQTANVQLYNSTDGVQILLLDAAIAGAAFEGGVAHIAQKVAVATTFLSHWNGVLTGANNRLNLNQAAMTQAWTGSWTLALRHTGVTAGGTFNYNWQVYKY